MTDRATCDFCERQGLPILPVRFAVAPRKAGAPSAHGEMYPRDCGDNGVDLGPSAHYTTRILRSGYLYVFDEARKRWQAYIVNPGGYFLPFDPGAPVPAALTQGREPCARKGHREIASCITISSPKQATNVWMAYSEVEWTPRILELHAGNAAFRAKHMRKLSIPALLKSPPPGEPIRPISRLTETVAEYAPDVQAKAFEFSREPWTPRAQAADSVIAACDHLLKEKGVIAGLNDPSGILQDLAVLAKANEVAFMQTGDRIYHTTVNGWLLGLEDQIKDGSQREWIGAALDERELRANPMVSPGFSNYRSMSPFSFGATRQGYYAATSKRLAGMDSADNLDKLADERWARYAKKLNTDERTAWQKRFAQELADYNQTHIAPLAEGHVAWMRSKAMKNYMGCVFDDQDPHSGLEYVQVMTACLQGTDDKAQCQQLYTDWMDGDPSDPGNLILSALAYNQQALKLELAALDNSVTWEQLPWDKLNTDFTNVFNNVAAGRPDVLGALIASFTGTIARALKKAALSSRAHAGLVAIGMATQQPVVRVEIKGSKKRFRAALIREMLRLHEPKISYHKLQKAVAVELRRLEVYGVPLGGEGAPKHWLLMVNPEHVKKMPKGLSASERAKWLARSITTPEAVEALNLNNYRTDVKRVGERLRRVQRVASYHAPFAFAVVGLAANVVAWNSLVEDEQKAMAHKQKETMRRVWAQGAQMAGAAGELIEQALKKLVVPVLRAGQKAVWTIGEVAGVLGKGIGVAGALVMAVFDLGRSIQEAREGDWASSGAFFVSFALGFAATIAVAATSVSPVIGLILVIALIGWSIVMTRIIDDDLQDWMERCVWGKLNDQRYGDLHVESTELAKALKA